MSLLLLLLVEIAAPGVPGPICVYGKDAWVVAVGGDGKLAAAVVAAGRLGKGRVVAFGHGGYLQKGRVPADPWGNSYEYEQPGQNNSYSFDLWSLGADGKPGGEGVDADLGNWGDDGLGT